MTTHDQPNLIAVNLRPTIAIVGGGGAMGRLFAQLFCGVAREIQLYDFFGATPRDANLTLALDDIRKAGIALGRAARISGLSRILAEPSCSAWRFTSIDE